MLSQKSRNPKNQIHGVVENQKVWYCCTMGNYSILHSLNLKFPALSYEQIWVKWWKALIIIRMNKYFKILYQLNLTNFISTSNMTMVVEYSNWVYKIGIFCPKVTRLKGNFLYFLYGKNVELTKYDYIWIFQIRWNYWISRTTLKIDIFWYPQLLTPLFCKNGHSSTHLITSTFSLNLVIFRQKSTNLILYTQYWHSKICLLCIKGLVVCL